VERSVGIVAPAVLPPNTEPSFHLSFHNPPAGTPLPPAMRARGATAQKGEISIIFRLNGKEQSGGGRPRASGLTYEQNTLPISLLMSLTPCVIPPLACGLHFG